MSKRERKRLARAIVKQVLKELGRTPSPAPALAEKMPQAQEPPSAERQAAREHVKISAKIAGWNVETADLLYGSGMSPATVARLFADALSNPQ